MSKKIKLANIIQYIKDIQDIRYLHELEKIDFLYSTNNSSFKFDYNTQEILSHYLPIIIILSIKYYQLSNMKNKLNDEIKNSLEQIKQYKYQEFKDNYEFSKNKIYKLLKKHFNKNLTKKQYTQIDGVQFDDKSMDTCHLKAFKNNREKCNILLKINSLGKEAFHIRIGINIIKEKKKNEIKTIKLMDIIIKKT